MQNLIERMTVLHPGGTWRAHDAETALGDAAASAVPDATCLMGMRRDRAAESLATFAETEKAALARALARHRWNVSATARSLGLSRGALRGRMARLGLA